MKRLIAGNWKMNLLYKEACELLRNTIVAVKEGVPAETEVMIAPPFLYLLDFANQIAQAQSPIILAAQNASSELAGALTGEVSPKMLADIGVQALILGHSERRQLFFETDAVIQRKLQLALDSGLRVVFCVGETLEQRDSERVEEVLNEQISSVLASVSAEKLDQLVIAYEPVWAIGTGRSASAEMANQAHQCIRAILSNLYDSARAEKMCILYGGSVNEKNASELLAQDHINGALVGGASLKYETFVSILNA